MYIHIRSIKEAHMIMRYAEKVSNAKITLSSGAYTVDASSILGIYGLNLRQKVKVDIQPQDANTVKQIEHDIREMLKQRNK